MAAVLGWGWLSCLELGAEPIFHHRVHVASTRSIQWLAKKHHGESSAPEEHDAPEHDKCDTVIVAVHLPADYAMYGL